MLRIIQNSSAPGAKSYYSSSEYYTDGQERQGIWRGEGAARLGLRGAVEKREWDALCDNLDPNTGRTLTLRQKEPRRIGYDFNFHVPKSVSLLYGLTQDERILDAFRASVDETMKDIESEMQTRVRTAGRNEDRTTGNLIYGEFIHFTARPVDGVPDPHLHAHCFVFNVTHDSHENRWKAGQFAGVKRDAPYFEAMFHSRMAGRMTELGLSVDRTKQGWELAAMPPSALEKFSRRTAMIEAEARSKGISNADEKSQLGAKTRQRKQKNLSMDELRTLWQKRLTHDESTAVHSVQERIGSEPIPQEKQWASLAMDAAAEHCFERKSVVPERELLATAIKRSLGQTSAESVVSEYAKRPMIVAKHNGRRMVTTPDVLKEEKQMLDFARKGRGSRSALVPGTHGFKRQWLNEGQRKAVEHVLHSRDVVTLIRGAAGVGKTSMMIEAVEAIEKTGRKVFTFAPSSDASRGTLRQEGFKDAETVAQLLTDPKLQQAARGEVLWIDEAGLLGSKDMGRVFELADKLDARVVLSGDRYQHGSVSRGAALRLLETEAGLISAEIKDIQRQKGAYKHAMQAMSEGRTLDGLQHLDALGWIREVQGDQRDELLAAEYVDTVQSGKSVLVVSPTNSEASRVTAAIREKLKSNGRLAKQERSVAILKNAHLTPGERRDPVNFRSGDVMVYHQNAKGIKKGQRIEVKDQNLPLDQVDRFQLFHPETLLISPGDVLRVTQNGKTLDGEHRLNNGSMYTVSGFSKEGDIEFTNGWVVSKDYGFLSHGYTLTSHAAQGKTVDVCLISQSSESFPASSSEQGYVSTSRARQRVMLYTDDKVALFDAINHPDDRMTATELVSAHSQYNHYRQMEDQSRAQDTNQARQREEILYER